MCAWERENDTHSQMEFPIFDEISIKAIYIHSSGKVSQTSSARCNIAHSGAGGGEETHAFLLLGVE